jgi:hypothetical protein
LQRKNQERKNSRQIDNLVYILQFQTTNMSYVEFNVKNLARMLSIMSDYFGSKEMSEDDVELRKKLEVMHKSEIEWQKEQEEENKEDSI